MRPGPRLALAVGIALACIRCGGAPDPTPHLDRVFRQPEVIQARDRAPDLVAAAERARRQAVRAAEAGREDAAQDRATRARLLLAAAVAESERLALEAERIEAEKRARALEARARAAEVERQEVAQQTRRLLAARVARGQAERAFDAAARVERRRRIGTDAGRQRQAAKVLRERARLLAAAARALGAPADAFEPVDAHLKSSRDARDPARALALAEDAVLDALRALGAARARADGPTAAEVRSLWQAAEEMGLELERSDRGTVVRPPGGRWSGRWLERLVSLLQAHPHGPVRIEGLARSAEGAPARRARSHAEALQRQLVRAGVTEERLRPGVAAVSPPPARVQVLLVAYVP